MKTIIVLVIICVVSGFWFQNIKAQVPQQISDHKEIKVTSALIGNFDTTFNTRNNSELYIRTNWFPALNKITIKPELTLTPIYIYHYDLIMDPFFVNSSWKMPEVGNMIFTVSRINDTFNAKWERLTGKPLIDKTLVFNSPMKRTSNPNLSDSFLYRLAGGTFRMMVSTKYPGLYETPNYPGANLPK